MTQRNTRSLKSQTACKLPAVARRLIEKNRQRRITDKTRGDFRGRSGKTIAFLSWKAGCNTLSEAIGYVASELERERLYALYGQIFPKEWKKSGASFKRAGENIYHTERELEFIQLVSDRLFPICSWLDWSEFRFEHIPVETVNYDFCCDEYEWREFRPCLQFAVPAFLWRNTSAEDKDWGEILASFNVPPEALPPINRVPTPFAELDAQRENPKIRRFMHLVEFIFHDSGNPFIDTTYCQPVDLYEWTPEILEKLKADYLAAGEYFASMESIDASIELNALATFRELIWIWNTGRLPSNKRSACRRRRQAAEKPYEDDGGRGLLINILADAQHGAKESALTF